MKDSFLKTTAHLKEMVYDIIELKMWHRFTITFIVFPQMFEITIKVYCFV